MQNILTNISSAPNIDALWVAATKNAHAKIVSPGLSWSLLSRFFFVCFISVKIDKNQLNTLFFSVAVAAVELERAEAADNVVLLSPGFTGVG